MNSGTAKRIKKAVARFIVNVGEESNIDLEHASRLARKMWTFLSSPERTPKGMDEVAAVACYITDRRQHNCAISRPQLIRLSNPAIADVLPRKPSPLKDGVINEIKQGSCEYEVQRQCRRNTGGTSFGKTCEGITWGTGCKCKKKGT